MEALVNIYNNCSNFFKFFHREKPKLPKPGKPDQPQDHSSTQHYLLPILTSHKLQKVCAQPQAEPAPGNDPAQSTRKQEHTLPHGYYNWVVLPQQAATQWCQNNLTERAQEKQPFKDPDTNRATEDMPKP